MDFGLLSSSSPACVDFLAYGSLALFCKFNGEAIVNVKPGDLAIVIAATTTPEMIGMVVKVERPTIHGERLGRGIVDASEGFGWICSNPNGIPTRYSDGVLVRQEKRPILDAYLKPVSGLPDEQTEEESLKLEV